MDQDIIFLQRAIKIAGNGIHSGGGPFGALIVRDGKIIAEAHNRVVLDSDPTAHAEILVIRKASAFLKSHELGDCVIYSSCEPCPMCLGAIYWAGIKKVIYACDRTEAEAAGFSDKMIYDEISLDPAKRKIDFIRISSSKGSELFKDWEEMENKTPY